MHIFIIISLYVLDLNRNLYFQQSMHACVPYICARLFLWLSFGSNQIYGAFAYISGSLDVRMRATIIQLYLFEYYLMYCIMFVI